MKPITSVVEKKVVNLTQGGFISFKHLGDAVLCQLVRADGPGESLVLVEVVTGNRWGGHVSADETLTPTSLNELGIVDDVTDLHILEPHEVPAAIAKALGAFCTPMKTRGIRRGSEMRPRQTRMETSDLVETLGVENVRFGRIVAFPETQRRR